MTKILLVEDDDNLRGIYGDRLMAEGYEIVAARDGEEALAMAVNEKPDLIISDVMMPKISGFDMLDILRSTEETKNTKVIMMTALSQKEDQERGEALGANRYLVKSQVTLEDVVRVAAEVLNEGSPAAPGGETMGAAPVATAAPKPAATDTKPPAEPATPAEDKKPDPAPDDAKPAAEPATPAEEKKVDNQAESSAEEKNEVDKQIKDFAAKADDAAATPVEDTPKPEAKSTETATATAEPESKIESASVGGTKTVEPLNDVGNEKPDINKLLEKEEQKEIEAKAEEATKAEKKPKGSGGVNPNDIAL